MAGAIPAVAVYIWPDILPGYITHAGYATSRVRISILYFVCIGLVQFLHAGRYRGALASHKVHALLPLVRFQPVPFGIVYAIDKRWPSGIRLSFHS